MLTQLTKKWEMKWEIFQMNKGGFSWRRFIGISAFKSRISRRIGIPLTRSGRQRKLGAFVEKIILIILGMRP
jgi:hypothetical protein